MTRVQIKQKISQALSEDQSMLLSSLMGQMTGADDADIEIIVPKIRSVKKSIVKYYRLFSTMLNLSEFRALLKEYDYWFVEIEEYIKKLLESTDTNLKTNYDVASQYDFDLQKKYSMEEVNKIYKDLKKSNFLKQVIITSSALSSHAKYLENINELNDTFIKQTPGIDYCPFSFSKFDVKRIWVMDECTDNTKKFILTVLFHCYKIGMEIYDVITSPDVNIEEFSEVLITAVDSIKGQVPRCEQAFDLIKNSVGKLKSNFNNYYRESIAAENPSIILENFIVDLASEKRENIHINRQFRTIMTFLKEKTSHVKKDDRLKQTLNILNENINLIEKNARPQYSP